MNTFMSNLLSKQTSEKERDWSRRGRSVDEAPARTVWATVTTFATPQAFVFEKLVAKDCGGRHPVAFDEIDDQALQCCGNV
jgi:hypothetical protein